MDWCLPAAAQEGRGAAVTPMKAEAFTTRYVRIGNDAEGLVFEPKTLGPKSRIALVFSHTNRDTFDQPYGPELANRGYRVLAINYRGDRDAGEGPPEHYLPSVSRGIAYMRSLPGVQRVIVEIGRAHV